MNKEDINSERHVFIMGVEHSGTTILYRMLAQCPEFSWCSNYTRRAEEYPCLKWLPFYKEIVRAVQFLVPVNWQKKFTGGHFVCVPLEGKQWNAILPDEQLVYHKALEDSNYDTGIRNYINSIIDLHGPKRALVKRPFLSRHVFTLEKAFPNSKFIYIVRDGKAVAPSLINKFSNTPMGKSKALVLAAEYWRELVSFWDKKVIPQLGNKVYKLRYEDFCADPLSALNKIANFCNFSSFQPKGIPAALKVTNEKRFNQLSLEQKSLLNTMLKDSLKANGYKLFEINVQCECK